MGTSDLCWMSAVELAAAIRARRLSPVEITRAVLERIAAVNPRLNAFCTVAAERPRPTPPRRPWWAGRRWDRCTACRSPSRT